MKPKQLCVLLDGEHIGQAEQDRNGKVSFAYTDAWTENEMAIPLSLSMPLAGKTYPHSVIFPFMENLLPDNKDVLERWGREFNCSWRNAFALLSAVGEDCAGAVQFLTDAKLEAQRLRSEDEIRWLTEAEIEVRLRDLKIDPATTRRHTDPGHFSLSGAQPKTALHFDTAGQRWGIPSGRIPTTHILKPPGAHFDGFAENEHFCLNLARVLGMNAATSQITNFGSESAIVVERYDRIARNGVTRRVHQEDMCQALGIGPEFKYENQGGPGLVHILEQVLNPATNPEDAMRFVDAVAFNFIIGGSDAHGKNYSILIGHGGRSRLAPIYDVASILPYVGYGSGLINHDFREIKMAIRIASEYHFVDIYPRHWEKMAKEAKLDKDEVLDRVRRQLARIGDAALDVLHRCKDANLSHDHLPRVADLIGKRAAKLQQSYGA